MNEHTPSPQSVVDWSEYQDDISDAISDSIDMDWNANDGARAVVRWLDENASYQAPAPSSLAGGEALDRFERAAFAKVQNLPRGTASRAEEIARRDAEYDAARNAILAALSPEAPAREGVVIGPWRISFYQPPIPTRNCDWSYCHEDYDGPDSPSWMSGYAATRDECIAEIFHQYEERLP